MRIFERLWKNEKTEKEPDVVQSVARVKKTLESLQQSQKELEATVRRKRALEDNPILGVLTYEEDEV